MGFKLTGTYTDLYQLAMGEVYFTKGHAKTRAVFDYFFRELPYAGGYAVFAGLYDLLEIIQSLHFSEEDLDYLQRQGFRKEYVEYLRDFRFRGTIYASHEGDVIFPVRPVAWVEGTILEAQLVETVMLNILNFQSLVATKASRMRLVAGEKSLIDFGLRRAQGLGGYHASRAAIIGGFNATSNVSVARDYDLNASGTMAHAYIQAHDTELAAFREFAEARPDRCVLLIDTYNTLQSGLPNAITVAKEMEHRGQRLFGVRLDSGDLAYLARHVRQILDKADLSYVKIVASNQLDEFVIKSLEEQHAPIDVFGVGTRLVTGQPDAALDGVYKLSLSQDKPRIKISETLKKVTLPHRKQVFRVYRDEREFFGADVIALFGEQKIEEMHHPYEPDKKLSLEGLRQEPLLHKVMENGEILIPKEPLPALAAYCRDQLTKLPDEYKRFQNSHIYKVGLSTRLKKERDELKATYK